ncbi:MAG TPA: hypothetical protein EYO31_06445 [Phycisphaerales bacterium]|nr:hypothetical protein [Phycisphaerales bacterium]
MPYLIMARTDIASLQVPDLSPNNSQQTIFEVSLPGQTGYVTAPAINKPAYSRASAGSSGVLEGAFSVAQDLSGFTAYLVDKVEPGGAAAATIDITISAMADGDTITLTSSEGDGTTYTATAGAEFVGDIADDDATALAIAALIETDPAALTAAVGDTLTAAAVANVVTITADTVGAVGSLTVLGASDEDMVSIPNPYRLTRPAEQWNLSDSQDAYDALLALVSAGTDLTAANMNTALSTVIADTDMDADAATSLSTGDVEELVSVMAGRGYQVAAGTAVYAAGGQFVGDQGGFTTAVSVVDPTLISGINGTDSLVTQNREVDAVVYFAAGASLTTSIASGTLSGLTAATFGMNTAAYRSTGKAFVPRLNTQVATEAALTVTPFNTDGGSPAVRVYDDDGTNLA